MELVSNDLVTMDEDVEAEDIFTIDVSGYEGPLHLLLDLSRKQKVDLLHVSILELATQYLDFIQEAQDKRIDLAADYLLMAAWLAYLKSRLLLPKPKKDGDGEVSAEDDARKLAFRLRRLDAMREAGEALMDGNVLGRDVFLRGSRNSQRWSRPPNMTRRCIISCTPLAASASARRKRRLTRSKTSSSCRWRMRATICARSAPN